MQLDFLWRLAATLKQEVLGPGPGGWRQRGIQPILWLINKSRSNRIFMQVVHALIENCSTVE